MALVLLKDGSFLFVLDQDGTLYQGGKTKWEQVFRVLDKDKTEVRYNGEWLELLNMEEILKLAASTTVARMLERDDFHNRYSHNIPIGLHEFFYPLMQAYDSVAIKADIELGGTDQTFNILMGRSLQKSLNQEPQAALFMPILEGLDSLIIGYFELATDILPDELDKIKASLDNGCNPKDCKLLLARTITALYHTPDETAAAEEFFHQAFTNKGIPEEVPTLPIPSGKDSLLQAVPFLVQNGFTASSNEFRRLLTQGGISLNGEKITSLDTSIVSGDVLKIGKKKFVKFVSA